MNARNSKLSRAPVADRFWLYCFATTITVALFSGHYLLSNNRIKSGGVLLQANHTLPDRPNTIENIYTTTPNTVPEKPITIAETHNSISEKPLLVLHVGPGKTATTSLQVDLTRPSYQACLAEGDYLYGGRFYLKPSARSEGPESFSEPLELLRDILIPAKARNTDSECSSVDARCWKSLQKQVSEFAGDKHLILSDEPLALRWTPENAMATKDAFSSSREILVVIGYRRFFDWLPSSIFQRNRKRLVDEHWPHRGELAMLDPLWPLLGTTETWKERHYTFTDSLVEATKAASLQHHILNMHDMVSTISSQFFCQVLPGASRCCENADDANATSTIMNVRTDEQVHQLYFDTITTAAAAKGLINKSVYKRRQVREALRQYHHEQKFGSWPMYCPTEKQLQLLLEQSLRFERELILPNLQQESRNLMEAEHREAFEGRVRDGAFCQLDIKKPLETFRDFFRMYSK